MTLIADRFLANDDGAVDLATGETIRLSIDRVASRERERLAACDRLAGLRHPLLLPLVDYGAIAAGWFEAHANLPALRLSAIQARRAALHLVRFLREAGIELDAATAARNVRRVRDGSAQGWRPVGVFLQPRAAVDTIRTVLEANGPPGVTAIGVHGASGTGLRTARLQIARMARLAGYVVIDRRFGPLDQVLTPPRHLCVLDWLTDAGTLPSALAFADASGARRHVWIRFCRYAVDGAGAIGLEPLMTREITTAIYLDAELGPSVLEVRSAIAAVNGNAGDVIRRLSGPRCRQLAWVHESAPEYRIEPRGTGGVPPAGRPAGIARLLRAVDAANAMARRGRHARAIRVLARCGPALAARGARQDAASAANALGELYLDRGKPGCAATAFQQAREWWPEGEQGARSLLGNGRVLLEQGRLLEAEGALRTAVVCHVDPYSTRARRALAEALILRGRLDAAEEALQGSDLATLSALRRLQGNIPEAARAAARAVQAAGDGDGVAACEAHASAAQVHAVLGDVDGVRRHNCAARTAARLSRVPALVIRVAAESFACLERAGAPQSGAVRLRLLRAAAKLSPLAAARVRCALHAATDADDAMLAGSRDNAHLIERFRSLLAAMHDAPDEAAALQVIVADLLRTVDACSVVVRSGPLGRQVADAGRPWPGEEAFSRPVIEGGAPLMRDGLTPEAAEPIAVGGSILGAIAVRWVTGARPPVSRVRDMLRIASAAAAPVLRALNAAPAAPAADGLSYPDDLLGQGRVADGIREAIRRAAMAPYPVLIEGESGSGKELVARAIHARSSRRARRFCAVNCAALSDDLLEAELFGHARGAFTGAVAEKPGMFEEADHGTIFLDEVAELTARAQAKLLRVLQEGEIRRVGENLPRKVDARVVAASNRRLEDEAASGRFRADLRFRLDVIRITLPPLRDRADDVPWLARRIWSETAARVGSHAALGEDVVAALARYDWPGNVREMQNVMASLAVHGPRRGRVSAALLPAHIASGASGCTAGFEEARLEFERRFVRAALARAGGRRAVAASQLGLSRQGLVKIIKRLGLGE